MLRSGDRQQIYEYIDGQGTECGDFGAESSPNNTYPGAPGWPEPLNR